MGHPQCGGIQREGWATPPGLYADAATGEYTVYAGSYAGAPVEAATNSIFWNTELPALFENTGVTGSNWVSVP